MQSKTIRLHQQVVDWLGEFYMITLLLTALPLPWDSCCLLLFALQMPEQKSLCAIWKHDNPVKDSNWKIFLFHGTGRECAIPHMKYVDMWCCCCDPSPYSLITLVAFIHFSSSLQTAQCIQSWCSVGKGWYWLYSPSCTSTCARTPIAAGSLSST